MHLYRLDFLENRVGLEEIRFIYGIDQVLYVTELSSIIQANIQLKTAMLKYCLKKLRKYLSGVLVRQ